MYLEQRADVRPDDCFRDARRDVRISSLQCMGRLRVSSARETHTWPWQRPHGARNPNPGLPRLYLALKHMHMLLLLLPLQAREFFPSGEQ
jgi:hypothetical protein